MKTRFYNSLEVKDKIIIKSSSEDRILAEHGWYKEAQRVGIKNIPDFNLVKENKSTKLELAYIDGANAYNYLNNTANSKLGAREVLLLVKKIISELPKVKFNSEIIAKDSKKMYLDKPLQALDYFFGLGILPKSKRIIINGKQFNPPFDVIKKLYYELENDINITSDYQFIHGDLTLSNLVIDKNSNLYFIDPRGSFGFTKNYGRLDYDIAKLYFSVVANFDSFNHHNFKLNKKTKLGYQLVLQPTVNQAFTEDDFFTIFSANRKVIKFINATIWLSLFPHLQESEEQTLAAYIHGIEQLTSVENL